MIPSLAALHAKFWTEAGVAAKKADRKAFPGHGYPFLNKSVGPEAEGSDMRFIYEFQEMPFDAALKSRFADAWSADVAAAMARHKSEMFAIAAKMEKMFAGRAVPLTIAHWDCHAGNLLAATKVSAPTLVDWQWPTEGEGVADLARLISFNMDVADRRKHGEELIGEYCDALYRNGVSESDYPYELALCRYRVWAQLTLFISYAHGTTYCKDDKPRDVLLMRKLYERLSALLADHGFVDFGLGVAGYDEGVAELTGREEGKKAA